MRTVKNEQIFGFDVDGTLVSMRRSKPKDDDISIFNPYTKEMVFVKPHKGHVDLLKEMYGRGRCIIVWSAAGAKWAEAVVRSLGLTKHVHFIMTKPLAIVDDKPASQWLSNVIFLDEGERT